MDVQTRRCNAVTGGIFGAIAQLGERYNGIVEVVGSIPSGSTRFTDFFVMIKDMSPSSSRPRTPPFHGGNRGSNPLGDASFTRVKGR